MKKSKLLLCFVVLGSTCLVSPRDSFGQAGTAGAFSRIGVGARARAMGDAYSALATGVEAGYYNPAGLPSLDGREAMASYRALSLDRQFTFVGVAFPIRPKVAGTSNKVINGGFSLSWIRAGVSDIDGRSSDGSHVDDLSNSENEFIFAFALKPASRFSLGLAVKVVWNRFPDIGIEDETISANGVGFDLGARFVATEWLTVGATVKDLNAQYRWNTEDLFEENNSTTDDAFPKIIRYGIALRPQRWSNLTFSFDYQQVYRSKLFKSKMADRFHLGGEGVVAENIIVRAGVDNGSLAVGGGYGFPLFGKTSQLNYAFTASNDRPESEHVFTWVFQF